MTPSENYNSLFLQHVGIDLANVNVAGGTGRCIAFTTGSGTDGAGLLQPFIKPLLTTGGHGAGAAIDYRGLKCTIAPRSGLKAYLKSQETQTAQPCCHRIWPWGYDPILFGDVVGYLPPCYDIAAAADAAHTYTKGNGVGVWAGTLDPGDAARATVFLDGGSHHDHLTRSYVEDDWLLLAFDGDVPIDPPDDDWRVEQGIPATGDYYLTYYTGPTGYVYRGIFRIGTQWYARTIRVDAMGDWLLKDDLSRSLTKQTAYSTASHDLCVWVDAEFRAAVTYASNTGVQGIIGNVQQAPPETGTVEIGEEASIWPDLFLGRVGAALPWDDHAATFRKPWLFSSGDMAYEDRAFPNPDKEGIKGFSGFTASNSSVARPAFSYHPTYLADPLYNAYQPTGLQGFLLTPDGEDVFGCRRACESNESFSCFLSHTSGTTEQEFGLRRLRFEDVENRQDLYWRYLMTGELTPPGPAVVTPAVSSAGFESWIGFSNEGATSIITAPTLREVGTSSEGVYQYNYSRGWYWADDRFDGMRTDTFVEGPPTVLHTERWTECQPLHLFVGAAGTRRNLLAVDFDVELLEDDVLVTLEWKSGSADPPSAPAPMGPWTAQISSVIDPVPSVPNIETTTRDGEVFAFVGVNGTSRWVHFQNHGMAGRYGIVRGLEAGSNTINFPASPDTYYQIIVSHVGKCGSPPQTTNGNSTTFTVDGYHVVVEVATSGEPFETPPPPPLPVIPICTFPFSNTPQCGGYGGGGGGGEMMMMTLPHTGVEDIDPDTFVTSERLTADAGRLAAMVPGDVDAVVAVARSGYLPAWAVANRFHLPVFTYTDGGGVMAPGGGFRMADHPSGEPRKVVIIDDTAHSGRQMDRAVTGVRARFPTAEVVRAVVYAHPRAVTRVDLYVATITGQHYLEWNWQNAGHGEKCGFDFDGILCEECPPESDDDGDKYRAFLRDAKPLFLPRRSVVPIIVTGRHEKYRPETEDWLRRHGVRWDRLVMRDFDRVGVGDWQLAAATFKARHYAESGCTMFAESEPRQAELIAGLTGKPVLCPAAGRRIVKERHDHPERSGRRCLHLTGRTEFRAGCNGWMCGHGCEKGFKAVPGGSCQTCPAFEDDGKF